MTATPLFTHPLVHHPSTPCAAVQALEVQTHVEFQNGKPGLRLRYLLQGEIPRIRLPAAVQDPAPTDNLWQHTCFEFFLGQPGKRAYREFNFSPSGHWACYTFSDERVRDLAEPDWPAPILSLHQSPESLVLDAWLPGLASAAHEAPLHLIGLAAVIETRDGQLSYWALHHPAERPDFHSKAGWITRQACLTTP